MFLLARGDVWFSSTNLLPHLFLTTPPNLFAHAPMLIVGVVADFGCC
jgi:hypothetical protein